MVLADLPSNISIAIDDMGDEIMIFYYDVDTEESANMGQISMEPPKLHPTRGTGPCNNAYMITWVEASKGYGPLLYDLAMEYATRIGGGLTADRKTVQKDAIDVWDYYATNRVGDVSPIQLDAFEAGTDKSCRMKAANADKGKGNWKESSLSKAWTKEDVLLKQLEASEPSRIVML